MKPAVGLMNKTNIKIASLNARSIFKDANKNNQKTYTSHLRSRTLSLDILCLQEISAFHAQDHLNEEQSANRPNVPTSALIISKHCAIICINQNYKLTNEAITLDERCITATLVDSSESIICHVSNVYAPAQKIPRNQILSSLHELTMFERVHEEPWLITGDFNTPLHRITQDI